MAGILTLKGAKKKALKAMSDYIRERDEYICFTCGKLGDKKNIDAGHLFSRRHNNTLFEEKNLHAQCVYCNRYLHGNLHIYINRFINKYGLAEYEKLDKDKEAQKKYYINDYLEIEKEYKIKLKRLNKK